MLVTILQVAVTRGHADPIVMENNVNALKKHQKRIAQLEFDKKVG